MSDEILLAENYNKNLFIEFDSLSGYISTAEESHESCSTVDLTTPMSEHLNGYKEYT